VAERSVHRERCDQTATPVGYFADAGKNVSTENAEC
jgi:hypothetical protein